MIVDGDRQVIGRSGGEVTRVNFLCGGFGSWRLSVIMVTVIFGRQTLVCIGVYRFTVSFVASVW